MSLGDDAPGAHHVEMSAVDATYRPTHAKPWRDPVDEQVRYLEELAEEIAALEDELAVKRARYEQVDQWQPEPSVRVVDMRGVKSAGVDDREEWAS